MFSVHDKSPHVLTQTVTHDDDDLTEVALKHIKWIKVVQNRATVTGFWK
jgi:hypothetical protein